MGRDFRDRSHFGGSAGDETFAERAQFFGHDRALDDLDPASFRQPDHRPAGDAVQEAIGLRGVNDAILDEKQVGARAFRNPATVIQHDGIGVSVPFGPVLFDGADHI